MINCHVMILICFHLFGSIIFSSARFHTWQTCNPVKYKTNIWREFWRVKLTTTRWPIGIKLMVVIRF